MSDEVKRMDEVGASIEVVSKTTTLAGKLLGPWITRRQANADAEATIQEAFARRVTEYIDEFPSHPDVMDLLATCGGRVGIVNLTRILQSAHSQLTDEARPEFVGDDWFANFREKARTCSDEDFAKLWASLLAGEVNKPGSYSQKTVNILADMDVQTANVFARLCKYALTTETGILLVVPKEVIGSKVSDYALSKSKGLGLVDFVEGHDLQLSTSISLLGYDGGLLEVRNDAVSRRVMVNTGSVHLTPFGKELAGLCLPVGNQEDSVSDIIAFWESKGDGAKVVKHAPIARTSSGNFLYSDGSTGFIKEYNSEQLVAQMGWELGSSERTMMAHKVALINMKGGVGKSTLAVNVAWEMATEPWHKRVLVVDLDPQFNCSQYLVGAHQIEEILSNGQPTVWDILEQLTAVPSKPSAPINPTDAVVNVYSPQSGGSIDLIPSRLELSQALRNPAGKERLLKQAIDQLEMEYDFVIIDCAPTESMLTTAAYLVADYLLIPVRPEFLSTIGLPLLEQSLNDFAALYPGNSPAVLGLAFNAISGYAPEEVTSRNEVQRVARASGWPVFDEEVGYSKSFPKSAREGRPIFWTPYARTTTKGNFRRFAREFANRIGI